MAMHTRRIAISGIRALVYTTHRMNASHHHLYHTTDQNLRLYLDINRKFQRGRHRRVFQ